MDGTNRTCISVASNARDRQDPFLFFPVRLFTNPCQLRSGSAHSPWPVLLLPLYVCPDFYSLPLRKTLTYLSARRSSAVAYLSNLRPRIELYFSLNESLEYIHFGMYLQLITFGCSCTHPPMHLQSKRQSQDYPKSATNLVTP
jgi:hypothetical protein